MARGDWMKALTPEQRKERAAKMRAAKTRKALIPTEFKPVPKDYWADDKTYIEHEPVAAPQPVVIAHESELRYMQEWKGFLNEYLSALSGLNALGIPSVVDYCRMCAGNGIHIIGCGCVCHRARKSLAAYANEFGPKMENL